MALVGAKGIALITLFLVTAAFIEYLIILHIHSGQRWVQFSDPQISDGFSKVEVENLEARYKKIKFFPAAGSRKDGEYWSKKKTEILSMIRKGGKNDDKVNVQAPPSVQPKKDHEQESYNQKEQEQQQDGNLSNEQNVVGDGNHNDRDTPLEMDKRVNQEKQVDDGELGIMKRAIGKKKEDQGYDDNGDIDEHGRPKEKKNVIEEVAYDVENGNGHKEAESEKQIVGEPGVMFGTAAKALAALSNFKKMVKDTFKGKLEEEGAKNEAEPKEGGKSLNEGDVNKTSSLLDESNEIFEPNNEFFNGHPMNGEPLVEHDKSRRLRPLSEFEAAGNNIMFTLRTTKPFHDKRLPLLFETWMRKANHSNIFIVTDGEDKKWLKKTWDESKS